MTNQLLSGHTAPKEGGASKSHSIRFAQSDSCQSRDSGRGTSDPVVRSTCGVRHTSTLGHPYQVYRLNCIPVGLKRAPITRDPSLFEQSQVHTFGGSTEPR